MKWPVQELADACDQLRDQMLRGLELSEKARCVAPAVCVGQDCCVLTAAESVSRGEGTGNIFSDRRWTLSHVQILFTSNQPYPLTVTVTMMQVRPLDPANTKRLSDIRELFLRVDQKTG